MKCFYHPTEDSTQSCSVCNRLLCAACANLIKGKVFCQDCLVQGAELARIAVQSGPHLADPKRAAFFAIVPGMGAVYNRQYNKALAHFATFALLSVLADEVGVFGFAVFSFWVFTIMDAYRSAQDLLRKQLLEPVSHESDKPLNTPLWGGALILLGVLFFLNNLALIRFDFVRHLWPLIFVLLGLYLVYDHYRNTKAAPPQSGIRTAAPTSVQRPKEL